MTFLVVFLVLSNLLAWGVIGRLCERVARLERGVSVYENASAASTPTSAVNLMRRN